MKKVKKSITKTGPQGGVNKELRKKLKHQDDSDDKPKKKKIRSEIANVVESTNALVALAPKKISKHKNPKKLRSIVGDSADEIQQLLEVNENDQAISLIYKKMLQSLVDLLPLAERFVRKTNAAKGVYQVNALISNIRELMVDVQAAQDRGRIAEDITQRILQPAFREMASNFIRDYDALDTDLRRVAKVSLELDRAVTPGDIAEMKDIIVQSRDRLANTMQTQYTAISSGLMQFLQR